MRGRNTVSRAKARGARVLRAAALGLLAAVATAQAASGKPFSVQDMVGLGKLGWRRTHADIRALYPFVGNMPQPQFPFDFDEWTDLRTTGYTLGACKYTLSFFGARERDELAAIGLRYESGDSAQGRADMMRRIRELFPEESKYDHVNIPYFYSMTDSVEYNVASDGIFIVDRVHPSHWVRHPSVLP